MYNTRWTFASEAKTDNALAHRGASCLRGFRFFGGWPEDLKFMPLGLMFADADDLGLPI